LGTMGSSYSTEQSTKRGLKGPPMAAVLGPPLEEAEGLTLGGPPSPLEGSHLTGVWTWHPVHPWRPHLEMGFTATLMEVEDEDDDDVETLRAGRPRFTLFTADLDLM